MALGPQGNSGAWAFVGLVSEDGGAGGLEHL